MIATWIGIVIGGAIAVLMFINRNFFIAIYIAFFVFMAWQRWQHFRKYGTPGD